MAVDRKRVIDALSKIEAAGDEHGMIPSFGVLVNQLPGSFWNRFAERMVHAVGPDMIEPAEWLLVNAAHECGYHTGYGIITSEEWKAAVAPMVKSPEDTLHGAFAVLGALGWAKSEIIELVPGEKVVVRAYDYYESDIVGQGRSKISYGYMIRGVSAAFMDLAYGKPYPNGRGTFQCAQVKGIECGDDYGEFVVTRTK